MDDQVLLKDVSLLYDLNILYLNMQALSWQPFAGYLECPNSVFCAQPYDKGVNNFLKSVDKVSFLIVQIIVGNIL